jgi:iron complex transport system ATP-binding protein
MLLNVANLSFSYNSHPTLTDISFAVRPGELTVILGPNGAGKTTLLKCLNAMQRVTTGVITIANKDVLGMDRKEIARAMGFVAQKTEVSRLTVFDAVLLGRIPHMAWRPSDDDFQKVDVTLSRLGLQEFSLRYLDELSGGELQKVAMARALVQEAQVLLLDEPTSALDLKNQVVILSLLRQVVDSHAMAGIMSMHDLNTALRFADSVIFLKDQRIHAAVPCEEVSAVMVEEVYGLPVEIHYINKQPIVIPTENSCPVHC